MREQNKKRVWKKQIFAVFLAAALIGGGAAGCGSSDQKTAESGYANDSYSMQAAVADEDMEMFEETTETAYEAKADYSADGGYGMQENRASSVEESGSGSGNAEEMNHTGDTGKKDSKKIIKRYNYSYETEEFDQAYAYLRQQIEAYEGYISSSEVYGTSGRTLYLTARIPAELSDQFVGQLGSLGTMVSQSESAEDITLRYTDTESRIASLKTEQERLLALLDKADSLDSIITLESRLTEVRYELENYQSQKVVYDDLVEYSTVTISLEEVNYTVEVDDSTVFTRIKTGLVRSLRDIKNSLTDFVVGLIVALPYLIEWALIILIIIWIIRKLVKRFRKKRQLKKEKKSKAEKTEEKQNFMKEEGQPEEGETSQEDKGV